MTLVERVRGGLKASLRDMLLLVAGILIAFWLDAGWEERQQNASDSAQLATLSEEFDEVIATLVRDSVDIAFQLESTIAVARLILAPDDVTHDEVMPALTALLRTRTLNVPSGAYTVLAETGALGRLKNVELRSLLGAWPSLVADVAEGAEWLRAHRDSELMPLLNEFVPLYNLLYGSGPNPRFPHRVEALLESRTLFGMLGYREQIASTSVVEMGELLSAARRIRGLLENQAGAS